MLKQFVNENRKDLEESKNKLEKKNKSLWKGYTWIGDRNEEELEEMVDTQNKLDIISSLLKGLSFEQRYSDIKDLAFTHKLPEPLPKVPMVYGTPVTLHALLVTHINVDEKKNSLNLHWIPSSKDLETKKLPYFYLTGTKFPQTTIQHDVDWYTEDRNPTHMFTYNVGDLCLKLETDEVTVVGALYGICHWGTIKHSIKEHFRYSDKPFKVNVPMDAVLAHGGSWKDSLEADGRKPNIDWMLKELSDKYDVKGFVDGKEVRLSEDADKSGKDSGKKVVLQIWNTGKEVPID